MAKLLRVLFIIGALFFIFGNVFIATLPSKITHYHSQAYKPAHRHSIQKQIVHFSVWKNRTDIDTLIYKVISDRKNAAEQLQIQTDTEKKILVQNHKISDTLIVQHIYGLGGVEASELKWYLKKDSLTIKLILQLGTKEKVLNKLQQLPSSYKLVSNIPIYMTQLLLKSIRTNRKVIDLDPITTTYVPIQSRIDSLPRLIKNDTVIFIPKQH